MKIKLKLSAPHRVGLFTCIVYWLLLLLAWIFTKEFGLFLLTLLCPSSEIRRAILSEIWVQFSGI